MLKELLSRYPQLQICVPEIERARDILIDCYAGGGKVLLCGNGGSCADCDHIVGELMKGFLKKRPLGADKKMQLKNNCSELEEEVLDQLQEGLPAISLHSAAALNTAFCNDVNPELIYAQSLLALAREGDVLIAISTSGNAKNVCAAAKIAKGLSLKVISLTGSDGGMLKPLADTAICVPQTQTFQVQELHLPVYHYLCAAVEANFFEK